MNVSQLIKALQSAEDNDADIFVRAGGTTLPLEDITWEFETSESGSFVYVHETVILLAGEDA